MLATVHSSSLVGGKNDVVLKHTVALECTGSARPILLFYTGLRSKDEYEMIDQIIGFDLIITLQDVKYMLNWIKVW